MFLSMIRNMPWPSALGASSWPPAKADCSCRGPILRPPLMPFGPIPGSFVFLVAVGMLDRIWLPLPHDANATGARGPEAGAVEANVP